MGKSEAVKVCVRCRPFNDREKKKKCKPCVVIDTQKRQITINKPGTDLQKVFTYDASYDMDSTQIDVYKDSALPIVDSVLEGYNGTVFAYGQTGAGKTFTMEGIPSMKGLIPNAFEHIFHTIEQESKNKQFLVRASMLEIYNEEIRDLLAKDPSKRMDLKESSEKGFYVKGLTSFVVKSVKEIDGVMKVGKKNRVTGATEMNKQSSRSHCIFTITVETSTPSAVEGKSTIRVGKLNMVDLAGSERAKKTGAKGTRLIEGCKINLSLSALGNVISALVNSKTQFVPYRDSKLTKLLNDSLGGNTKTVMMANISPADDNYDETLSTLRYASRAKKIQNSPTINEDPKDAMLRAYQEELAALKAQLEGVENPGIDHAKKDDEIKRLVQQNKEETEAIKLQMEKISEHQRKELTEKQEKLMKRSQQLNAELQRRKTYEEKQKKNKDHLLQKIKKMEAHIVPGGKSLLELNEEQAKKIEEQKKLLLDQRRKEIGTRRKLEEQEHTNMEFEEKYTSLQDEIDLKTRKLKKLWQRFQNAKNEIKDLESEFQQEREDYMYTIRKLENDLKLKVMIIDNFIPPTEQIKITKRAEWDESRSEWDLRPLGFSTKAKTYKRPQSASGLKRPMSEYAKMHSKMGDVQTRYKHENIIDIGLEMPERTTQDFVVPQDDGYDDGDYEEDYDDNDYAYSNGQENVYYQG